MSGEVLAEESAVPAAESSHQTDEDASKPRLSMDLVWKVLAVIGVLFLVFLLFYMGAWLGMLN